MKDEALSQAIQEFLTDHIRSVVELEVLLLLQASPDRDWTAEALAGELRIDVTWAAAQLIDLCARKILTCTTEPEPRYRYAPNSGEMDRAVRELAEAYADRRVSVISFIYSKPIDQIKSFADAFRLRKDKSDG